MYGGEGGGGEKLHGIKLQYSCMICQPSRFLTLYRFYNKLFFNCARTNQGNLIVFHNSWHV